MNQTLAAVQRHMADTEKRIARQSALVERLAGAGRDTAQAARTLHVLEQTLGLTREHIRILLRVDVRDRTTDGRSAEWTEHI